MAEFVCGVREKNPNYLSACKNLPQYRDTGYCVLHFAGEEKKENFEQVKKDKLEQEDYDFSGAVFPEGTSDFGGVEFHKNTHFTDATFIGGAQFSDATFSGVETYFSGAQFSGRYTTFYRAQFSGELTHFIEAQFSSGHTYFTEAQFSSRSRTSFFMAQFSGEWTYFQGVQFSGEGAIFRGAQFSGVMTNFVRVQFSGRGAIFQSAQFSSKETAFHEATFIKMASFGFATFKEKAFFQGNKSNLVFGSEAWAWFNACRIEKPELLTFNTVLLHPGWFVDTDVRKVGFTDVNWYGMPGGPEGTLDEEINALKEKHVESPHYLLAQACRRLSANAEENREYPLANEFHYWAMDAVRKGSWNHFQGLTLRGLLEKETWRDIGEHFGLLTTLYWLLSGYGVRATRAFLVLVGICAAFAALYMVFGPPKLGDLGQALVYSLGAVARLNPEPRPTEPGLFQFLVIVEGLLGPLQIALLALAVRRKVMR